VSELFDTHCHLDDPRFAEDFDAVLARAAEVGVTRMATIGCARSVDQAGDALAITKAHDHVVTTIGVHPHDAAAMDDALHAEVARIARDPKVVALGEMGLDFYYDNSPRETQKEVFRKQIALAREVGKPIVVHTRDAREDTLAILREESARDVGGIIHCFSEDAAFAAAALDLGFVASFSGIVTFKNAKGVRDAAAKQPADAILVETDAPYLAPVPKRGKRNEPSYVAHTAAVVAELRGEDPEALRARTTDNALRVFGMASRETA